MSGLPHPLQMQAPRLSMWLLGWSEVDLVSLSAEGVAQSTLVREPLKNGHALHAMAVWQVGGIK